MNMIWEYMSVEKNLYILLFNSVGWNSMLWICQTPVLLVDISECASDQWLVLVLWNL